jgi:hypothetical protein
MPGWEQALANVIALARTRTVAYGTHDCCAFSASAVEAITGVDYLAEFRGYQTPREASVLLKKYGGLRNILIKYFGQPVDYKQARRGDVVLLPPHTLGLCLGKRALYPRKGGGLISQSLDPEQEVWHTCLR